MIIEEIKKIAVKAESKELRKFGYIIGSFLILLGSFLFWKNYDAAPYIVLFGGIIFAAGLALPAILRPVYMVWMSLAVILGQIVTTVILSLIFLLLFAPAGIIIRILKKDPLEQKFDRETNSYWVRREKSDYSPPQTEKQY